LYVFDDEEAAAFLKAIRIFDGAALVSDKLLERNCCKRAFIRGIFLACGSVTDPNSGYHLEMTFGNHDRAVQMQEIIGVFELETKIIERKNMYVVYMKEGSAIADFLNIIGAHIALMDFENVRILKEMRNSINRQVNCETANIKKTVSAASRQTEDIRYIHDKAGFGILSENLAQIAKLRLENPDVTLKELGEMLNPPLGKSGVNHRLRRLSEIAEDLRKKNTEC
jgi:DNA-binding protein WhiA